MNNNEFVSMEEPIIDMLPMQEPINNMMVTIPNRNIPIVIPFGPRYCGKSMMIKRLCCYLHNSGKYYIRPVEWFRPPSDKHYQQICDSFNMSLNLPQPLPATAPLDTILLEVLNIREQSKCYLLDTDGGFYFDESIPSRFYPPFLNKILNSPNPKHFLFFATPDLGDEILRQEYVKQLADFTSMYIDRRKDKVTILYNKCDVNHRLGKSYNRDNVQVLKKECQSLYDGLMDIFRQTNPILHLFQPYICDFVPFSTGLYYCDNMGNCTWGLSPDIFPQMLWQSILKSVK